MKIRTGFVSNSSSSSFCIYGTCIENTKDIVDMIIGSGVIQKHEEVFREILNLPDGDIISAIKDEGWYAVEDLISSKKSPFPCLSIRMIPDYDGVYIGESATSIKDDETGRQFKDRIEKELTEVLGDGLSCGYYSEGWYDG